MLKILAVDDCTADLDLLQENLQAWLPTLQISYTLQTSSTLPDPGQLTLEMPDLLFMDIELAASNGIDDAAQLKKQFAGLTIVLMSSFPQYSIDGYRSGAVRFLTKPLDPARFQAALDPDFLHGLEKDSQLSDPRISPVPIAWKRIAYIEYLDRSTFVHLDSGSVLETGLSIKEWLDLCEDRDFVQCYKSILVSLPAIESVDPRRMEVRLSQAVLPLSRHFKKTVEQKWQAFVCSNL